MTNRSTVRAVNIVSVAAFTGLILLSAFPQGKASADNAGPDSKSLYGKYCSVCHGLSAKGAVGPSLHNMKIDDQTAAALTASGDGKGMPAFGKKMSASQIAGVIAYIHTIK
jgi:mono/diheme cytochrome c family protein